MIFIKNATTVSIAFFILSGCVSTSPKTGWIHKDSSSNTGTYIMSDGSRYEGEYSGDNFHGKGKIVYDYTYYGNYPSSNNPQQLSGGILTGTFNNDSLVEGPVVYSSISTLEKYIGYEDEFKYTGGYQKGFKGEGTVSFRGGRVVKGIFNNEPTPYYVIRNERPIFKSSTIIGSYFEGPVSITWPNGAKFEGISYRYYLFDRNKGMYNSKSIRCVPSFFYGRGTLKFPGKKDYSGIVTDITKDRLPEPAKEENLIQYINELAECNTILETARRSILNAQRSYDAEMKQGRDSAQASLARDLLNMPNKIRSDMAGVEAASRGSTVSLDREKARRDIDFNESRSRSDNQNKNPVNLKSNTPKNNFSASSTPTDNPDTSQQIVKNGSKRLFPFTKSVTYQSTYGSKGKERALETVNIERKNNEPHFLAFAATWSAVSVSSPSCAASEHGLEHGHWVCKVTVMYKGESTTNPNSSPAGTKRVQAR